MSPAPPFRLALYVLPMLVLFHEASVEASTLKAHARRNTPLIRDGEVVRLPQGYSVFHPMAQRFKVRGKFLQIIDQTKKTPGGDADVIVAAKGQLRFNAEAIDTALRDAPLFTGAVRRAARQAAERLKPLAQGARWTPQSFAQAETPADRAAVAIDVIETRILGTPQSFPAVLATQGVDLTSRRPLSLPEGATNANTQLHEALVPLIKVIGQEYRSVRKTARWASRFERAYESEVGPLEQRHQDDVVDVPSVGRPGDLARVWVKASRWTYHDLASLLTR